MLSLTTMGPSRDIKWMQPSQGPSQRIKSTTYSPVSPIVGNFPEIFGVNLTPTCTKQISPPYIGQSGNWCKSGRLCILPSWGALPTSRQLFSLSFCIYSTGLQTAQQTKSWPNRLYLELWEIPIPHCLWHHALILNLIKLPSNPATRNSLLVSPTLL